MAPDNTGQQLAVAEMLLRSSSTATASQLMANYRKAANLASAVRTGKRRWRGDSVPAAHLLQASLILAGDNERALRAATALPEGEATAAEAASALLALPAARIAYEQGHPQRAEPFAHAVNASGDQAAITHLAAIHARAFGTTDQEVRWRAALTANTDEGVQLVILGELADLGCWPLPELDQLRDDNLIRPGMYELVHARALAARGDSRGAQVLLRGQLAVTSLAAETYARLLAAEGRADEAVAACAAAAARFGDSRHDLHALDILAAAGRTDEVLTRASALLARTSLPYSLRHHVRGKLLNIHRDGRDWAACERLAHDGTEETNTLLGDLRSGRIDPLILPASAHDDLLELHRRYAWLVILNQFNQGHTNQAFASLTTLAPEIRDPVEAELWLNLHRLHEWTPASIDAAYRLTEQHQLPEQLTGRVLFTLIQASRPEGDLPRRSGALEDTEHEADAPNRVAIPGSLHQRITDGWREHLIRRAAVERPGPASGLLSHEALRDQLVPLAARQAAANEAIWNGRIAVGIATAVTQTPYLLGLAERRARILPAADPDLNIYRGEREAAAASLGASVSIEPSALLLSAALLEIWGLIQPEFSTLLLAEPAAHDVLLSHVAARALGGDVGYFSMDLATGSVQTVGMSAETLRMVRQHCAAVHSAAQDCAAVHLTDLSALEPVVTADINGPWPWLAPVALAAERRVALYSDDSALRALARKLGMPAFGTLALIETLNTERGLSIDSGKVLAQLFAHHAVDLPDISGLVFNAVAAGDATSEPALINLARPSFWRAHNTQFPQTVASIVTTAYQHDAETLAPLTLAIATGSAAAYADTATATALAAATILTECTGVNRDAADVVVPAVQAAAAQYGVDPTARLRELLVGALTDPSASLQLTTRGAEELVDHTLRRANPGYSRCRV